MGHIANLSNSLYQKAHLLKAIIKLIKTKNIISFLRRPELVAVLKIGSSAPWFFKTFCICNTYGIQSILCEKNIPHRDCNEMGAISKYLSNIAFFCIIYMYIGKNSTFCTTCKFQFLKKHKLVKFWKIVKWYLYVYGYCLLSCNYPLHWLNKGNLINQSFIRSLPQYSLVLTFDPLTKLLWRINISASASMGLGY